MALAADVVMGAWGPRLCAALSRARVIATCVLLTSQTSCMLVGYDGVQAPVHDSSDGGTRSDGGTPRSDGGAPGSDGDAASADGSAVMPIDGGGTAADASRVDTQDSSTSQSKDSGLVDTGSGGLGDAAASVDAGGTTPLPPADAGDVGTSDAALAGCMGTPALGLCWHLGAYGISCDETCDTNYGGFDVKTVYYTGKPSEGAGSLANCQTVLVALGVTAAPTATYRPDGLGLGCHVAFGGASYWLDDRQGPFDAGDSLLSVRRACACAH